MSEINDEIIENIEIVEEVVVKPKKPRGRPRKPESEKPIKLPKLPKVKKEKPPPKPRVKKEPPPPRPPMKVGRKVGTILAPWRHNEDGTYNHKPLDPTYSKTYFQEFGKLPYACECGTTIYGKSNFTKHQKSRCCMERRAFKVIPELYILNDNGEEVLNPILMHS